MKTRQIIKEMNVYRENLSEANRALFDKILLKVRFSKIRERDAEEFSYYCLDLFLQAEKENRSVEEVMGTNDVNQFCDDYISGIRENYNIYERMYLKIKYVPMILFIFVGIWELLISYMIPNIIAGNSVSLDTPITLALVIEFIVVMFITEIAMKYAAKISWELNHQNTRHTQMKYFFIIFGIYLLFVFGFVGIKLLFAKIILFHLNFVFFISTVAMIMLIQDYYDNKVVKN
ncbi:hypothetical protein bsdtb5_16330 [Anaeromicropila herbilytica]|uniref:Uncharacterized protein n=2 Tax=Anaeromicropila herbilytica TaxID=2785025 RepID=A0A7R7IDT2_9FIRM|nr:hypothetical protein bsdtb5_16330 [Anaeromicropila herbilytica]